MEKSEFRENFPSRVRVPEMLAKLLAFQNEFGFYSGGFELTDGGRDTAIAWFDGDKVAASQFILFAHESDDSPFGFWIYKGRTIDNAPLVKLGSEGDRKAEIWASFSYKITSCF